ncbi:hypothetical protein PSACC_01064 [Paramicrosporidium saccamoebae]|uniref:Uncharacterized protein n=1 Tax=Paramicrosporidium saccamoebae TaxID=1246581 RepID=A0A2H9TN77_9FUNG|nr:hypothetical protein PSACC_01064 [Paramicrosporidium saccamoebae]
MQLATLLSVFFSAAAMASKIELRANRSGQITVYLVKIGEILKPGQMVMLYRDLDSNSGSYVMRFRRKVEEGVAYKVTGLLPVGSLIEMDTVVARLEPMT